jgi:hypothetical protein
VDALKDRLEQGARFHGDAAQSAGKMPAELVFVEGPRTLEGQDHAGER